MPTKKGSVMRALQTAEEDAKKHPESKKITPRTVAVFQETRQVVGKVFDAHQQLQKSKVVETLTELTTISVFPYFSPTDNNQEDTQCATCQAALVMPHDEQFVCSDCHCAFHCSAICLEKHECRWAGGSMAYAIYFNHARCLRHLLRSGKHTYTKWSRSDVRKFLKAHEETKRPHYRDHLACIPLTLAIAQRANACTDILLESGANPFCEWTYAPLVIAAGFLNDKPLTQRLLAIPASNEAARHRTISTTLMACVAASNVDMFALVAAQYPQAVTADFFFAAWCKLVSLPDTSDHLFAAVCMTDHIIAEYVIQNFNSGVFALALADLNEQTVDQQSHLVTALLRLAEQGYPLPHEDEMVRHKDAKFKFLGFFIKNCKAIREAWLDGARRFLKPFLSDRKVRDLILEMTEYPQ